METQTEPVKMDTLLRQEMQKMKDDLHEMKGQMKEMYQALIGNSMLQDGGLVGRITKLELRVEKLDEELEQEKEKSRKMEIYQKLLWAAGSALATGAIGYIMHLFTKS